MFALLKTLGIAFLGLGALATAPLLRAPPANGARLYVADLRSSDVATIALSENRAIRRTTVAEDPHELTATAGGIWVSDYRSQAVTVLGGDGTALGALTVAGQPHGLARIGDVVAVTQGQKGSVALLNAASGALIAEIGIGGEPHIVVAAAGRFYAADAARGLVFAIDPETAGVTGTVRVGEEPEALAVSPDGATLAVSNARSHDISLVDLPELRERARLPMPGSPVRSAFSPDGRTLAISMNDSGYVLFQRLSTGARSVIAVGRLPDGLAYTPDGRSLYVALSGENKVAQIDVKTLRVVRRITVGDGPSGLLLVPAT